MSSRKLGRELALVVALTACVALALPTATWGGHGGGRIAAVGGVSINSAGVVDRVDVAARKELREMYLKDFKNVPTDLNQPVELRKISLKAIEKAIAESEHKRAFYLPDEVRFLAGIQRIQYVFVYPEENDIVIAGPGEGWKVDENAEFVGVTTGKPVLRLEDLAIALRTVENARQGGISVSIDPTAEGRQAFEQYMSKQKVFNPAVLDGIAKALGQQEITINGVSPTTRFARTLVAADYHMKRIAMKLDESPVKELPSFLDLMKQGGKLDNMMPRWWLACNYEPLAKSEDGLAWELRGPGVKVMTEDEVIGPGGAVRGTGKANRVAQKFSDLMTEHYDELATKEPVFGDLRNLMDMCVVAALISKEGMLSKANLDLPCLLGQNDKLEPSYWHAPKSVATQCSFVKRDREFLITASGGVDVNSWEVASKSVTDSSVAEVREQAATKSKGSIWWN
jgi:hypothetical protein